MCLRRVRRDAANNHAPVRLQPALTFHIIRAFRGQFGREDLGEFVDRYGFRRYLVEIEEAAGRDERRFGAMSDRVERGGGAVRSLGEAEGVMPTLYFDWLLPQAVPIRKADLDVDLPPKEELPVPIAVEPEDATGRELLLRARALAAAVIDRIKADSYGELAGKLFGALGQVPSYLDRCTEDTGNGHGDAWESRYPASVGGGLVGSAGLFPASWRTPKERWLLRYVGEELARGRRCLVLLTHTGMDRTLVERLLRLLRERFGQRAVAFLDTERVTARKRKGWIDREVVGRGVQVLLANPLAIQTGLNSATR